jgi:hypothetical protein
MSNYECPNCHGGFPEPIENECPWCGQPVDGSYEYEPRVEAVSRIASGESETRGPLTKALFGGNNE